MLTKKSTIAKVFLLNMLGLLFLAVGSLAYFWISQEYQRFDQEAKILRAEYVESQKALIQREVEQAVAYLQYYAAQTEKNLQAELETRVTEAYEMAWHLYQWGNKVEVVAPEGLRSLVEGYQRSDFDGLP